MDEYLTWLAGQDNVPETDNADLLIISKTVKDNSIEFKVIASQREASTPFIVRKHTGSGTNFNEESVSLGETSKATSVTSLLIQRGV